LLATIYWSRTTFFVINKNEEELVEEKEERTRRINKRNITNKDVEEEIKEIYKRR